ncbi:MAG: fatty acid desaturase CarF family protein [Myxococcota bacterium]|nr:fatty acid desaturase CarF family protein [Myxococcota bacterium]
MRIRGEKWSEAADSIRAARAKAEQAAPAPTSRVGHIALQALGATAVAAEVTAAGFLAHAAASQIATPAQAAIAGATFALGYLGLEALWGAGHAFLDQARPSAFPRIREVLLASQRHHLTPADVTVAGPFDYMAPVALLLTPIVGALAYLDPTYWASTAALGFALGATITLDVHRYTHLPAHKMPALLKLTSRLGLTQKRDSHWVHHRDDDKNVCQLTDYVNPLYNKLGVYERIGNALRRRGVHVEQTGVLAPCGTAG